MKLINIIYRITHKNKKIKGKDIDTKQKLRYYKNATKRYYTENKYKNRRKQYERKNLLQCGGHCKNAWCEYGESLQNP